MPRRKKTGILPCEKLRRDQEKGERCALIPRLPFRDGDGRIMTTLRRKGRMLVNRERGNHGEENHGSRRFHSNGKPMTG